MRKSVWYKADTYVSISVTCKVSFSLLPTGLRVDFRYLSSMLTLPVFSDNSHGKTSAHYAFILHTSSNS
jgi:hypothetical protein